MRACLAPKPFQKPHTCAVFRDIFLTLGESWVCVYFDPTEADCCVFPPRMIWGVWVEGPFCRIGGGGCAWGVTIHQTPNPTQVTDARPSPQSNGRWFEKQCEGLFANATLRPEVRFRFLGRRPPPGGGGGGSERDPCKRTSASDASSKSASSSANRLLLTEGDFSRSPSPSGEGVAVFFIPWYFLAHKNP